MNISISSNTTSSGTTLSSTHSSVVDNLQHMKENLMNELKRVNESKSDNKTKAEKSKEINQQITAIEQQILQVKADEQQQKIQEALAKNAEKVAEQEQNKDSGGVVLSASLNELIAASSQISSMQTMGKVQAKLKGEIAVADSQIKHTTGVSSITSQLDLISRNTNILTEVEHDIGKAVNKISNGLKTAATEAIHKTKQKKTEEKMEKSKSANTTAVGTANTLEITQDDKVTGNTQQLNSVDVSA